METNATSAAIPALPPDVEAPGDASPITFTPEERARALQALKNLRGMFAGTPSLEDEYFREREKDRW